MSRYSVDGKVALVTGGARGIGLATAKALGRRGASLVMVDLDQEAAERAAAEVDPARAIGLAADVTDRGALQRVVSTAVERFGGLDVVVANAGIAARGATMRASSTESFERVMDVNAYGVLRTVEAALPEVVRRKGHIVVVSSIYAFMNGMGVATYAMSKAAVEQLGRALRAELAQHGASASVAYFGFIDTDMVRKGFETESGRAAADRMGPVGPKHAPPVSRAGRAIVRAIERRSRMAFAPSWILFPLLFRTLVQPLQERQMIRQGMADVLEQASREEVELTTPQPGERQPAG